MLEVNTFPGQAVTLLCQLTLYSNVSTRFWEFSAKDSTEFTRIVTQWPRDDYFTKYDEDRTKNMEWNVSSNFSIVLRNVSRSAEGWHRCGMSVVNEAIWGNTIYLKVNAPTFEEPQQSMNDSATSDKTVNVVAIAGITGAVLMTCIIFVVVNYMCRKNRTAASAQPLDEHLTNGNLQVPITDNDHDHVEEVPVDDTSEQPNNQEMKRNPGSRRVGKILRNRLTTDDTSGKGRATRLSILNQVYQVLSSLNIEDENTSHTSTHGTCYDDDIGSLDAFADYLCAILTKTRAISGRVAESLQLSILAGEDHPLSSLTPSMDPRANGRPSSIPSMHGDDGGEHIGELTSFLHAASPDSTKASCSQFAQPSSLTSAMNSGQFSGGWDLSSFFQTLLVAEFRCMAQEVAESLCRSINSFLLEESNRRYSLLDTVPTMPCCSNASSQHPNYSRVMSTDTCLSSEDDCIASTILDSINNLPIGQKEKELIRLKVLIDHIYSDSSDGNCANSCGVTHTMYCEQYQHDQDSNVPLIHRSSVTNMLTSPSITTSSRSSASSLKSTLEMTPLTLQDVTMT